MEAKWLTERVRLAGTLDLVPAGKRFTHGLDLGCGAGQLTSRFCEITDELIAVDISAKALERARERCGDRHVEFVNEDMYRLEFPPARFDVIFAIETLDYTREKAQQVAKWHDWLTPGGYIFFTGPLLPGYFTYGEITSLFSTSFEILEVKPLTSKFPLAKLASHRMVPWPSGCYRASMRITRLFPRFLAKHIGVVAVKDANNG